MLTSQLINTNDANVTSDEFIVTDSMSEMSFYVVISDTATVTFEFYNDILSAWVADDGGVITGTSSFPVLGSVTKWRVVISGNTGLVVVNALWKGVATETSLVDAINTLMAHGDLYWESAGNETLLSLILKYHRNKRVMSNEGSVLAGEYDTITVYDDDLVTPLQVFTLVQTAGASTSITPQGD